MSSVVVGPAVVGSAGLVERLGVFWRGGGLCQNKEVMLLNNLRAVVGDEEGNIAEIWWSGGVWNGAEGLVVV